MQKDGANAAIRELDSNEELDRSALEKVTYEKLHRLLSFSAKHVPYYRNLFEELGVIGSDAAIADSFTRLPVLTKAKINNNRQKLISEDLRGNGLDENSTGGSTGEVLRFFTDWKSGAYRKATVRRNKRWIGIRPGDREVRLWGAPLDIAKSRSLRGTLHSAITRERLLSADALDEHTLQQYLNFCKSFRPRLLVAYPSALAEFARFCDLKGDRIESLQAILCSAETLSEFDRKLAEGVFGVKVYDRYGCREVGDIAQEAPGVDGLLVNSDRVYVEVLNKEGKGCKPGEQGEVLVTDLDNYGMPLIRYRIGDYATWAYADTNNSSGFPFPILASVDGRTLDVVRCIGGNRIGGTYWTLLLRSRPGLRRFQVIQDKPDKITVLYERETDSNIDFDYFRSEIAKTCGPEMHTEFIETSRFEHEPGSKFRLVICRIDDN
jgi:phenylacetate-CoA ligase